MNLIVSAFINFVRNIDALKVQCFLVNCINFKSSNANHLISTIKSECNSDRHFQFALNKTDDESKHWHIFCACTTLTQPATNPQIIFAHFKLARSLFVSTPFWSPGCAKFCPFDVHTAQYLSSTENTVFYLILLHFLIPYVCIENPIACVVVHH